MHIRIFILIIFWVCIQTVSTIYELGLIKIDIIKTFTFHTKHSSPSEERSLSCS